MPNEDFPVISPQGKERNSVCDKIIYFLLGAVKHCLVVPVLVEPAFPGCAYLHFSSHPGFCGPRRKGAWFMVMP